MRATPATLLALILLLPAPAPPPARAQAPAEAPEARFARYARAWGEGRYGEMHALLTERSRAAYPLDGFTARHANIYGGIGAKAIAVVPSGAPEPERGAESGVLLLPFAFSMDTRAGTVSFAQRARLRLEPESGATPPEWRIEWSHAMIHPDLGPDDKVRVARLPGMRGRILDRNGAPLAEDGDALEAGIVPGKLAARSAEVKLAAAKLLGIDAALIDRKLSAAYVKPDHFIPLRAIPADDAARKEALLRLPGVMLSAKRSRLYPLGARACHLTGYVQRATAEDLKREGAGYGEEDLVGRVGLESRLEGKLRPYAGWEIRIADAGNRTKRVLARIEPVDGSDVRLTVDARLQAMLYDELSAERAAAVALDPHTGEALALVSAPGYDPAAFALGLTDAEWGRLVEDPALPLSNRFQRAFCPGSVVKPFVAAIGLALGTVDPDADLGIKGLRWQADKAWGAYHVTRVKAYAGPSDLAAALLHSDNIWFARAALGTGAGPLSDGFARLGVGENIPFAFALFKSQVAGKEGIRGDIQLADTGYGQGEFLMNPVQLACMYSLFANKGDIVRPVLLPDAETTGEAWIAGAFPAGVVARVLDGLDRIVRDPRGTGHDAFMKGLPLAGKTGTAELKRGRDDAKGIELGWFAAFDRPAARLLLVLMAEDVKERGGSHHVLPMARRVFAKYLGAPKGK